MGSDSRDSGEDHAHVMARPKARGTNSVYVAAETTTEVKYAGTHQLTHAAPFSALYGTWLRY